MKQQRVALAATVHDPDGHLHTAIMRLSGLLLETFSDVVLNISDATHAQVIAAARDVLQARVVIHPTGEAGIGRARRDAVGLALQGSAPFLLYIDFDHLIRWMETDVAELQSVLAMQPDIDCLVIGRSQRSFAAEPKRLQETERLVNKVYALMTGRKWDLMFAVRRLSRKAAEAIMCNSRVDNLANDVEWPLLAERCGCSMGYADTNGLYYRTIEEFGEPTDTQDGDAAQWIRRIEFAAEHAAIMRRYLPQA